MDSKMKFKVYTIVACIVIVLILLVCLYNFKKENYIIINNNTDITLSRLSIAYKYSDKEKVIELPDIQANNNYKMKLSFPDGFTEGSIKIDYIDIQGLKREEYIAGYIEKGNHNNITVTINSVDLNGILSIRVHK